MEKHELGTIDFELIDDAFKALLKSQPDPMTADKIADLRDHCVLGLPIPHIRGVLPFG
jgi:hypothetical protein